MKLDALKERTVGWLLVGGGIVCVLSVILGFAFAGGGIFHATATREPITDKITDPGDLNLVPLTILGFTIGLGMMGGGIWYGLWSDKNRFQGVRENLSDVFVISRFAYTPDWQMLTNDWELDAFDDLRYMVQLELRPGQIVEFECLPEVFYSAGEGTKGDAEFMGKWLGKYVPYIGVPTSET